MEERPDKRGAHTDPHHREAKFALEIWEVQGSKVGELHPLEVAPEPFVRVQFGSMSGEVLDTESGAMLLEEVTHESGPMSVEVIPDENDGAVDVPQEVAQENEHLGCGDGAGADEDKEPCVGTHSRDGRELRPGIPVDEDRGLAVGRPGPYPGRHQPERRFVGENPRGPTPLGFFLIRGHSTATQWRMAPSSRSEARLVGRWHDQPH